MKYTSQSLSKNVQKGVYAPLFDCLSKEEIEIVLDLKGLKESIARELETILNTRPVARDWKIGDAVYEMAQHLPQYFGLRDFTFQQAANEVGRRVIVQEIIKVIQAYEPRLKNVQVKLSLSPTHSLSATVEISGDVKFGNVMERTIFPVRVKNLFYPQSQSA